MELIRHDLWVDAQNYDYNIQAVSEGVNVAV